MENFPFQFAKGIVPSGSYADDSGPSQTRLSPAAFVSSLSLINLSTLMEKSYSLVLCFETMPFFKGSWFLIDSLSSFWLSLSFLFVSPCQWVFPGLRWPCLGPRAGSRKLERPSFGKKVKQLVEVAAVPFPPSPLVLHPYIISAVIDCLLVCDWV